MYDMFYDLANSAASQFESVRQDSRFFGQNSAQVHSEGQPPTARNHRMAPPASKKSIRNLHIVQVTSDDLLEESNKECLICLDDQKIGSNACKLACGHLYHQACLTEWLQKSCTCPVCRYELETDDAIYEKERKDRMLKRKMRFRLDELRAMKVSQLRDVASILIVSLVGCIDKSDVIDKLLASGMIELIEGAPATMKTLKEFEAMGVAELRCSLLSFGLSDQGALEKNDLRLRLLNSGRIVLSDSPGFLGSSSSNSGYGCAARGDYVRNIDSYISNSHFSGQDFDRTAMEHPNNEISSMKLDGSDDNLSVSGNDGNRGINDHVLPTAATAIHTTAAARASVAAAVTASIPSSYTESDVRAMNVSELRKVSTILSVSLTHCLYKEDIIESLLTSGKITRTDSYSAGAS